MAKKKDSHIKSFNEKLYLDDTNVEQANIAKLNTEQMQKYGANINLARVFPDIHDGLKLIERRIIYTMGVLMKAPLKKKVKVLSISGQVVGSIHPHGDASVYNTLVRIAQPWNMLIPYIEGQGNFGTIAGDEAAAARYIEAKLSPYAIDCFLSDFDPNVVLMEQAYNTDYKEPLYLPSKYPNCLLSSADGLGFGPATHIPTFNLEEVLQATIKLIKNPKYEPCIIPDITTGCLIVDEGKFPEICATGRGTFKMKAEIIKDEDNKCIIIKSIPFQVSLLSVKEKIKELVDSKVLIGFKQMKDYSATKIHLELYFRPEVDLENIINILYTKTRLQETYPVQMKMVDEFAVVDFSVKSALLRWIGIRYHFKRKKFIRKLVAIKERNHILEILIRILDGDNGEKTIKIIKKSSKDEIIDKLVKTYDITTLQAKEIANMKLSAFSKTALADYKAELKENTKLIKEYNEIIKSPKEINKIIISELEEGIKKYAAPRRCKVIKENPNPSKYSDYEAKLIFTKNGYIKKLKDNTKKIGNLGELDEPVDVKKINNNDKIVMFDKRGSVHTFEVGQVSQDDLTTIGTPLSSYVNINGTPVSVFRYSDIDENTSFVFITKNGIIKKSSSDNFAFKNSIIAITLKPDDELVSVIAIKKDIDIVAYTKYGFGSRFNTSEIPFTKRMTIGVIAFPLQDSKDCVIGVKEITKDDKYLFILTEKGYAKKCTLEVLTTKKRRSEPVSLIALSGKDTINDIIACTDGDVISIIMTKDTYQINTNELPVSLKFHNGDKVVPVKRGDQIIKVHR
ncbi:MAG: DNA topoisomerase (ATP-hydrolyzing) subunit A [Candidatus Onthovivens sp.]|nr:DNA topoisomerase (ATP-hydrolyzing) subunit A [Candidatus Onthovivens sp.]